MKHSWSGKKLGIVFLCPVLLTGCSILNTAKDSSGADAVPLVTVQSNKGALASIEPVASVEPVKEATFEVVDFDSEWSSSKTTSINLNGQGASVDGSGATVKDNVISITGAGTYAVSGKLDDGQIVIDVQDNETVRLILNGAEIHSDSSAPIYVKKAGKTIITLQKGTNNQVSDNDSYVFPGESTDEPNSAIFSKEDLTINGSGKLIVRGNYNNGITSKDSLKITGGTLEIYAVDDGLMGRDLVAVHDGQITIEAGGDGIKTTNDTDEEKGSVAIYGGTFTINSGKDGIQASSSILIDGGTYTIKTGKGSQAGKSSETESQSAKAIKSGVNIQVNRGTFTIDSADDSIHSNGTISISGGTFRMASGDDGIHANASIAIAGGTIDITRSYEGIESAAITVSGGDIRLISSDDGVNVARSSNNSSTGARSGQGRFSASASNKLTISGGYLSVEAQGDGLDANGSIAMTGGTVIVNGPTANNNGPLDYDGTFEMTGGFLIAAGSSRMAQATSEQSTQHGVLMTYSRAQAAGTLVHLKDSNGKTIVSFAPSKSYQSFYISSPSLQKDASYSLYTGGTSSGSKTDGLYKDGEYTGGSKLVEFRISKVITWLNESGVTEGRGGNSGGFRGNPSMGGGRM